MMSFILTSALVALLAASSDTATSRYPAIVQESSSDDALKVFVVPMKGQVGTDIHLDLYKKITPQIKESDPDLVIFHINSHDLKNVDADVEYDIMEGENPNPRDASPPDLSALRDLRIHLRDELDGIPQICYVEDAYSLASLLALSWEDFYIAPDADFGGAHRPAMNVWPYRKIPDQFEKYLGWTEGPARSLAEYGGWDTESKRALTLAMIRPDKKASMMWHGSDSIWLANNDGDVVVDDQTDFLGYSTVKSPGSLHCTGRQAQQYLIADGLAEPDQFIHDILAQRGHRQFKRVDQGITKTVQKHRDGWKQVAENARDSYRKYQRYSAVDRKSILNEAKKALERYIGIIRSNDPVRIRMNLERLPTNLTQLNFALEDLKERIRNTGSGAAGGGGGRGGGGGGGGGM